MGCGFYGVFGTGLVAGSISSLAIKAAYQTEAMGADGQMGSFDKPWLMSLVMFGAMALALPWYLWQERGGGGGWKTWTKLGVPTVLDLLGSSLQQMGLVLIPVSSFQMLKGSILVFSAWFTVWLLPGRRLEKENKLGIIVCVIGVICVGIASILSREDQTQSTSFTECIVGIVFVLSGQVLCAAQYVCEEFFLQSEKISPVGMVGIEGFWGVLLMSCVVLPLLSNLPGNDIGGVLENTTDSLVKISNSTNLQFALIIYFFTCLLFNICGVMVTKLASAVHHTFLDATRTGLVWIGSLALFYLFPSTSLLGEPLTTFSWLQALGFFVLIYGQLIYDAILTPPSFLVASTNKTKRTQLFTHSVNRNAEDPLTASLLLD
jgi:drug/metabolite transporter (DMT)-like permease